MLTLTATPLDHSSGAAALTMQYGGGGAVASIRPSNLALAQTELSSVEAVDGSTATIALDNAGAVTGVTIDGYSYALSEDDASPGTFSWDSVAGTVTLHLAAGHQPIVGTAAAVQTLRDRYNGPAPTGEVLDPAPTWFSTWNIQGSFSWNRSFSDQPGGSFSFVTAAANERDVRSQLQNGTKLTAFGMGFSIAGLAIARLSERAYPGRQIQVEVSLTGFWVEKLAEQVKLKRAGAGGTISELAGAAGVPYSGATIGLNQSANTSDAEFSTVGAELEKRAISSNGFSFYSDPASVQVRPWRSTRLHSLSVADLTSPVQIAIGGNKAHFYAQQQDNRLSDEYRNTVLTLDLDASESDRQRSASFWVEDGDENCETPPLELLAQGLENLSNNHDAGGTTKERTRTLYRNGVVLKVIKQKFGFAYRGIDVYRYVIRTSSGSADPVLESYSYDRTKGGYWGLVEETIETYNYDPKEGYLLSVPTVTRRYSRLKQEQDAKESIVAEFMPTIYTNGRLIKDGASLRAAYRFQWRTEFDTTTNTLASFLGLYPDVKRPKDNKDWVEPKYAVEVKRTSGSTFQGAAIDPSKPAPLAGRVFTEVKRTIVNYPSPGLSEENWNPELEIYTVKSRTENQQGESLRDALKIGTRSETPGRPGTHTRAEAIVDNPTPPTPKPPSQQKSVRALLNTPGTGLSPDDPESGSVSFSGITDYGAGLVCARTQISIANTKSVEVWKFSVHYNTGKAYQEGDRLSLMGKLLVILSIDSELSIQGSLITSEGISISAGLFLDPPVTLTYDESDS